MNLEQITEIIVRTKSEWAEMLGVDKKTIDNRVNEGLLFRAGYNDNKETVITNDSETAVELMEAYEERKQDQRKTKELQAFYNGLDHNLKEILKGLIGNTLEKPIGNCLEMNIENAKKLFEFLIQVLRENHELKDKIEVFEAETSEQRKINQIGKIAIDYSKKINSNLSSEQAFQLAFEKLENYPNVSLEIIEGIVKETIDNFSDKIPKIDPIKAKKVFIHFSHNHLKKIKGESNGYEYFIENNYDSWRFSANGFKTSRSETVYPILDLTGMFYKHFAKYEHNINVYS
ncbi:MAG: hypothetical protein DWQ06_03705 [Calditrichaeota bacterium]|nr:MAG: hypothetical protein DWQ06_03705 [Calditrichota bacterium]